MRSKQGAKATMPRDAEETEEEEEAADEVEAEAEVAEVEGEEEGEGEEEDGDEGKPKKRRKSVAAAPAGGGAKAALAELQKRKKAAVKAEDYAEAQRLKQEIDALQEEVKSKGKAGTKVPAAGTKRPLSPPKGKAAKKPPVEEKRPVVEELTADPFFDDKTPALLLPHCFTAGEREAWRAVEHGNVDFLSRKLVGTVPLFCQRDVVSKQTALHLAIEKANTKAISALASQVRSSEPRKRATSMAGQQTGTMSVLTLGFETGKIGAARGGRELNNALVDPKDKPEPLQAVIGRAPLSPEQLMLLMSLNIVRQQAVIRRKKIIFRGGKGDAFSCDIMHCLEPALRHGRLSTVRTILERLSALGVGPAHTAAVSLEPMPDRLQARSVTAKLRFGGNLTSVHLAAINPDAARLKELLKLEPTALTMPTEAGLQAIHFAAACEGTGPLKLLLSEWSADRRSAALDKRTPLHFAAAAGRAENVKVLMGGGSMGPGSSHLFMKEIRVVLLRQKPANIKIGMDGICILSRLLVDLLLRIVVAAARHLEALPKLGVRALHKATKQVLKGALALRIAEKSGKLTAGLLGLPSEPSALARALSTAGEDVLQTMFSAIDQNSDGKLVRAEIQAVFDSANMKLSKKQFAKVVKEMDADGNGEVSLEEFSSWMEAGSTHATALRRHLVVDAGAMGQAEVAEAEVAEEEELLQDVDKLAFDARPLLQSFKFPGADNEVTLEQHGAYASAILECACTKVLEVSANAARSQKKTSVAPEHILNGIKANGDLQGLYEAESVVMNNLLLQVKDKEGYTALHTASEAGHLDCVETLIACGADVDAIGPERKTPLALAAERGHVGCVKALVKAGAKLELADKRKRTALLLAVRAGHTVIASILLHHGASPNAADDSGNTIVHYAAAFGWQHCVDLLHQAGAELSSPNAMKLAPITAALQKGHKSVFRRMLELGIDVNFRDADGSTLLLGCLGTVNRLVHDEIQFMMSKKADPTLASSTGTTALHALACASVDASSPNFVAHPFEAERLRKVTGWTPRPRPLRELPGALPVGDDDDSSDDEEEEGGAKESPAKKRRAGPAEGEELDVLVYRRGFYQLTTEQREAVFRLGWNQMQWQAGENPTALWGALDESQRKAAQTLGLDESTWVAVPVRIITGIRNPDGSFPCAHGMAVGADEEGLVTVHLGPTVTSKIVHVSMVLLPEEDAEQVWSQTPHVNVAIARLLLDSKAAVDARDISTGATPLMLAISRGFTDLALLLLDCGADANAKDGVEPVVPSGQPTPGLLPKQPNLCPRTPLGDASKAPCSGMSHGTQSVRPVIAKLLAKGCIVTEKPTQYNSSPVLNLISSGAFNCALMLLEAKADPSADCSGQNALHKIFSPVFPNGTISAAGSEQATDLARRLLTSPDWGAKLLAAHTRNPPHVTPLHSLVEAFTNPSYSDPMANTAKAGEDPTARAKMLMELLELCPGSVDLSHWTKPAVDAARLPQSPLSLLCSREFFEHCRELGVAAVTFLCRRGISANATAGSPAALHSLAERLQGHLSASTLSKVLLPLTDMNALMPNGHTLLTFVVATCVQKTSVDAGTRESVRMLLEAQCDPNLRDEPPQPGTCARPALHMAAMLRDEGLVLDLLASRADPNLPDNPTDRRAPLHFAVLVAPAGSDANFDVEEVLLRGRADPAASDALGRTALHYAFMKGVDALNLGAEWLQHEPACAGQVAKLQWTAQAWKVIAGRIDPIETISSLCVLPGINVNAKDRRGMSPLHLASLRGASIAALKLISAGASLEDDFHGNTPLGLAMHSHPEMAVLLMQRAADTKRQCHLFGVPVAVRRAPCLGTPESIFSLAVRQVSHPQDTSDAASTYLGAAIAALDCGFPRSQALNDTIASQQFVMLLTLIPKVGDEVLRTQRFEGGHNLLHRLAAGKRGGTPVDLLPPPPAGGQQPRPAKAPRKLLLRQRGHGGQVDDGPADNAECCTAKVRHEAAQGAFVRAAGKLLERGVAIAPDERGQTPLHLAAQSKHGDLVTLMLCHGSMAPDLVRAVDEQGRAALGCALAGAKGSPSWSVALQIAKELIAHGASARQALVDVEQQIFALTYCIISGERSLPRRQTPPPEKPEDCWPQVLFASEPPDVTLLDAKHRSCLTHAALAGKFGLPYLRLIMRWAAGAGVARELLVGADEEGLTALMHAVDRGSVGFVDALLQEAHQVSPDVLREVLAAKAPDGSSALMRAVGCPDGTGMLCTLARWMDGPSLEAVAGAADASGQTALIRAVLRNSLPMVQVLLQGRPLQPLPMETTCPAGKMAGDTVVAKVSYAGSAKGAPSFSILECLKDGEVDLPETSAAADQIDERSLLTYVVRFTVPPGTGPGMRFTVAWESSVGGPGLPGLAGGFAGVAGQPSRVSRAVLSMQDKQGQSALHCCVRPLPFGSFENTEILAELIQAGVASDLADQDGQTAAELASKQRSGKLSQCLQQLGIGVATAAPMEVDEAVAWPPVVDVDADAARALQAAEAAQEKVKGKPLPPVEKAFQRPSQASRVVVAYGTDGGPLDLVMTKVDLQRGPCPQNVFYRMQVLHELNQDNYFLFTRWGRVGDSGQHQTTPFESLAKATTEFCKIFKSKAGNDWAERADFVKKPLKYQLHDLKYPSIKAADALCVERWQRLPTRLTPLPLRRVLNIGASPGLLAASLQQHNIEQPLGALKRQPLEEARGLLERIKALVREKMLETRKSEPSGERLQAILDEIASASSRIYELVPTKNFQHSNVGPINTPKAVKEWYGHLEVTDDIACAARLLLGAQAQLKSSSPTDYVYRALGICAVPLAHDSPELHLIERYINRSSPGECRLFTGEGAVPLPEKPQTASEKDGLPRWQALQEVICYTSPACLKEHHAELAVPAGGTVLEYAAEGNAICIRQPKPSDKEAPLWVRTLGEDGSQVLLRLSEREVASKIAAIYRLDRKGEETRAGGDTAALLFHGSGMVNVLSILSQGLRVKPPGVMHQGSAFGNGIYFANTFRKSRGYSSLACGVGFMLLSEVATGRELDSRGFNFQQAVREARISVARARLGLAPDALPAEHPGLQEAIKAIDEDILTEDIEDLSGTPFDSFHFHSGAAPHASGAVVHPDGYRVPCGEVVGRDGGIGGAGTDEIIVYETSRVRLRYVLELRDPAEAHLVKVEKPEDTPEDAAGSGGAAGDDDGGSAAGKEDEKEDKDDEDDSEEEEDDD